MKLPKHLEISCISTDELFYKRYINMKQNDKLFCIGSQKTHKLSKGKEYIGKKIYQDFDHITIEIINDDGEITTFGVGSLISSLFVLSKSLPSRFFRKQKLDKINGNS